MKRRSLLRSLPAVAAASVSSLPFLHASAQNSSDALVLGCTAAMTGPLGGFGRNMKQGVDAAVTQINAKGGVLGRPLKFVVLDDAYQPPRSVENVKKLMDDPNVVALLGCLGTANNAAISPLIEAAGTPHLGPLTGASSLRKSELRNVFHVRASYTDEMQRLVRNLVSMGIRDLAMVHLDNPYGKEIAEDASQALTTAGIKALAMVPVAVDGKNLETTLRTTLAAKPSAVLLGTSGSVTTGVIAGLKAASPLIPIAGISATLTQEGVAQLGPKVQGFAMTMVYPDANSAKHAIVRDYQAALRAMDAKDFSNGSLEGYINTRIMAEALTRAGRGAGRDKLRQALASLRSLDLGGFVVDYGSSHVGSKYVELGIMSSEGKLKS